MCLALCNFTTYVGLCVHHHSQATEQLHHTRVPSVALSEPHPPPIPPSPVPNFGNHSPGLYFYNLVIPRILYKWNHTVGKLLGLAFLSLSIIPLRFIQIIVCIHSLFLFTLELYSVVWINHSSFSHSRVVGHLGFSFLAFINKSPMNIHEQFLPKKSFYFSRFKADL